MIDTICQTPSQIMVNPVDRSPTACLRLFKNAFLKRYIGSNGQLSGQHLSALLLYFALRCLQHSGSLKGFAKTSILKDKSINELKDNELAALGNHLFDLLQTILPDNLNKTMTVPDTVSWHRARTFFEEQQDSNGSFGELFGDIADLGFAYQIFSLGTRKKEAVSSLQKANKAISQEELVAFTQLYTPHWVVDFLVANTILPDYQKRQLSNQYSHWQLHKNVEKPQVKQNADLLNLRVLDPACGAGQFLFSSFDLLLELYKQEGYAPKQALPLIVGQNIVGADIDAKALCVAGLGLLCKCLIAGGFIPERLSNLLLVTPTQAGKSLSESSFLGSIDKRLPANHLLKQSYQVIITNPPYIGRKCLSRDLKTSLKEQYPDASADLSAAFLKRSLSMLCPGGKLGFITQSSLLSIPTYKALRNYLVNNYHIDTIIRCGPGVFPLSTGEKIDSMLLLIEKPLIKELVTKEIKSKLISSRIIDLRADKEKYSQLENIIRDTTDDARHSALITTIDQANIELINSPFAGLSSQTQKKISALPKLGDIAEIRQGLATTNNARFVRYAFDVDKQLLGSLWVPYIKGAGGERYASENPYVVKWGNNGQEIKSAVAKAYPYLKGKTAWVVKNEEFYFRPGLCFSFINKTGLAVRRLPAGVIFDVAGSAIFAKPEDEDFLLAYLNSNLIGLIAKSINQTINLQVGDLKKIPIFPFQKSIKKELSTLGQRCFEVKQKLLQLQRITMPTQNPCSLTSQTLDLLFEKYSHENQTFINELNILQGEIDNIVVAGIKQSSILSKKEEALFHNGSKAVSNKCNDPDIVANARLFAAKILVALVSNIISSNESEQVRLVSISKKDSLTQLFNISLCAKDWLEQKLGKSLEQLFCSSRVFDVSKLAGNPSRYFSLWFAKTNSCMFFSTTAVRKLLKDAALNKQSLINRAALSLLNPVLIELGNLDNWTSKDLITIVNKIH